MFAELLVPLNSISYSKKEAGYKGYNNLYFQVGKGIIGWEWIATRFSKKSLKEKNIDCTVVSQNPFNTWQQARDDAYKNLCLYFPDIDKTMYQSYPNSYFLYSHLHNQRLKCLLKKENNLWGVRDTQHNLIIPHEFRTREECMKKLYDFVSNNLLELYLQDSNTYQNQTKDIVKGYSTSSYSQWWKFMVKPEFDLSEILDQNNK